MADGHGGNATKDGGRRFAFPPYPCLAFDSGEYTRVGEEDKDPSEMYTRPAIATIISQDETKTVLEAFGVS